MSKPKYAHLHAWDEVLAVPAYVTQRKLKDFTEKDAPEDSIYEICEFPEDGSLKPTGKFQPYSEITGEMKNLIAAVFERYGWGTP